MFEFRLNRDDGVETWIRAVGKVFVGADGKPEKLVRIGPLGPRLTPRGSFEEWKETVSGCAVPWTATSSSLPAPRRCATPSVPPPDRGHADVRS